MDTTLEARLQRSATQPKIDELPGARQYTQPSTLLDEVADAALKVYLICHYLHLLACYLF